MAAPSFVTCVALLRGINVGGNAPVPMSELKAGIEALGYTDVRTYINSGNVVFRLRKSQLRTAVRDIERALLEAFGQPIPVVLHTLAEMDAIVAAMPAAWTGARDLRCDVIFLRPSVDKPDVLADLPGRDGVDDLSYAPGVVFWSAKKAMLTKSTMTKMVGTPLYRQVTMRGASTTLKVHALMREIDAAAQATSG